MSPDVLDECETVHRTYRTPATPAGRSPVPTAPQQSSQLEQELAEVKGHLRSAEEQNGELAEQLKVASASVEQYRAVVLTLEDSLKKEKEVRLFVSSCSFQCGKTTDGVVCGGAGACV